MEIFIGIIVGIVFLSYIVAIILLKVTKPKYDKPIDRRWFARSLSPKTLAIKWIKKEDITRDWTDFECENLVKDICDIGKQASWEEILSELIVTNYIMNAVERQSTPMWKFTKFLLWDLTEQLKKHAKQ
jgi:hypothetical protein